MKVNEGSKSKKVFLDHSQPNSLFLIVCFKKYIYQPLNLASLCMYSEQMTTNRLTPAHL